MKRMRVRNFTNKNESVQAKFVEVKLEEVGGDEGKLIKKFLKKVRKEEILKPYFGRLMYYQTKGQKKRQKKIKNTYESKKNIEE